MIETIYIENAVKEQARTKAVLAKYPDARLIFCERYSEVFNPKAQNFRLQKKNPSLILTNKHKGFVLPAPLGYGIGAQHNYYFSHMLNCPYDCRYCFLQGMYRSAHYVFFINYEDFDREIRLTANQHGGEPVHFFSGYDCDSLAFESTSGFAAHFVPLFKDRPHALLELRTKSTQINSLLEIEAMPNVVVAYSMSPVPIAKTLEHGAPSVSARIRAMKKLADRGWPIGLRFDPLLYQTDYQSQYQELFEAIFSTIPADAIHSISFGAFRLPSGFFNKLVKLYPDEKLFAGPLDSTGNMASYKQEIEEEMHDFCKRALLAFVPEDKLFPCSI